MSAAAELPGPRTAHLDNAYRLLVVGFAKQGQRANFARLRQRHDRGTDVEVLTDRLVSRLLDVASNLLAETALPCEVESQIAGLVVGAALERGRTKHLSQRGMHDGGAGVCLACPDPPFAIDSRQYLRPAEQLTLLNPDPVHDQALHRALYVDDLELHAVADDSASV